MRAAFKHLVDGADLNPLFGEIAWRTASGDDLEAHVEKLARGRNNFRLVAVLHRHKDSTFNRHLAAAAKLALCKSNSEAAVEAHDFAGGTHFRAKYRVNAGEARE